MSASPDMLEKSTADLDLYALVEDFFLNAFSTDNALITEAVRRMLAAGGKRLRPRFTLLGAAAMGATDVREHLPLAAYMELIHVATLIHDDVVDNASTRRGVNATAIDFGNRVSVLAGDYLFAWIFKNVTASYAHPIPHILSATLADITDGEVLQLRALGNLDARMSEYVEIAAKKTARLFASSAECGAWAAGGSALRVNAVRDFGLNYGIAFQMQDDLLDMTSTEAALGKPVGNDLREKKMTIPVILALDGADRNLRADLERFYDQDDTTNERIAGVIAGIAAHGGLTKTQAAIADYLERAKASLAPLGNAPARAEFVAIADTLLSAGLG
jgi:geranylgeranyl pyrophosphate synthase